MKKAKKPVKILLCGIGGYGAIYTNVLLDYPSDDYKIVAIVDPKPNNNKRIKELINCDVAFYDNIEDCYSEQEIDLCVISSPIQYHATQSIYAMENGSDVLCEKPIAGSLQDAKSMIETSKRTGKMLTIGFQWSFMESIINLKKDLLKGVLGKINSMKYITLWNRSQKYFTRNQWAGKIKDDYNRMINDSILQNATAHHLHNLLFLAGEKMNEATDVSSVEYEVYRANEIETYDTVFARFMSAQGVPIFAVASHAVLDNWGPQFEITTSLGKITYLEGGRLQYKSNDGKVIDYGEICKNNLMDGEMRKLFMSINNINNNIEIPCVGTTAVPHLKCVSMIDEFKNFDKKLIDKTDEQFPTYYVKGLDTITKSCYLEMKLPKEKGIILGADN